ncbi:hypothetical protein E2C01_076850 [Portunus trituberculatus]|uniref:Uncharacterized protein n=1 Tax=Portunus trituberculatus TaxID=210409 RepID=A0A5B7IE91_PORTR|nr:hypothetical protein [Portunus trituberculatus]
MVPCLRQRSGHVVADQYAARLVEGRVAFMDLRRSRQEDRER